MLAAFISGAVVVALIVGFLVYRAKRNAQAPGSAPAGKGGRVPGAQPK